jgi:hypothetical protein
MEESRSQPSHMSDRGSNAKTTNNYLGEHSPGHCLRDNVMIDCEPEQPDSTAPPFLTSESTLMFHGLDFKLGVIF